MESFLSKNKLFDLEGRVAIVTGGAGWLGAPIVSGLAEAGAHVLIAGRRETPLVDLAEDLIARGLLAEPCPMDIEEPSAIQTALNYLKREHGRLDILVNSASSDFPGGRGLDAPDAAFAAAVENAITASWRLTTKSLPLFREAVALCGDASVINITSMYGKVSPDPRVYQETNELPNPAYYGTAKAGLLQLTRWLACNLGPEKIRVNSISPGPFTQWNARERVPDFVARLGEKTPLGRIGERDEIKGAVVFLASHAASYITGADIPVDGGWTSW